MIKKLSIILALIVIGLTSYAKPHCQGFNNYGNKVTIVFTDDNANTQYNVTDIKLHTYGETYVATGIHCEIKDGVATVTLTFPHITQFSNPRVTLRINGQKTHFKVCQ